MPVVCDVCDYASKSAADNRCHKNFSHRKRKVIFRCRHCGKKYLKFKSYQEHNKVQHEKHISGRLASRIKEEKTVSKPVWKSVVLRAIAKRGRDRLGWMQYNIRRLVELCYYNDVYSIRVNWQDFPESSFDSFEPMDKLLVDVPDLVAEFLAARENLKTDSSPVLRYDGETQGHSGPSVSKKETKKSEKKPKKEKSQKCMKEGLGEKIKKKVEKGEKSEKTQEKVKKPKKVEKVEKVQHSSENKISEIIDLLNESVISNK